MGQQLGRVEQHIAHVGAVEQKLQQLIERFDETPAQLERAASIAAQETARLVGETGLGKPSARERLDALHRDIVAMNERNNATDDRLVDTLVAMHESLKGLVQQGERDNARAMITSRTSPHPDTVTVEPRSTDFVQPESRGNTPTVSPPPFGSKRTALAEEAAEERPRRAFIRDIPFDSTEHLVAAARRAAQAAAARAEERDALPLQQALSADEAKRSDHEPGRHKVSFLMVAAALLLMVSAALLLTRLKPDFYVPPPAAERAVPAPAGEARPLPEPPFQPEVTPYPGG
jgi:hypothetical protein